MKKKLIYYKMWSDVNISSFSEYDFSLVQDEAMNKKYVSFKHSFKKTKIILSSGCFNVTFDYILK